MRVYKGAELNNLSPLDFLKTINSGSVTADLKIDGSKKIGFELSKNETRIHIEDLDFVKLMLKITNLLKSPLYLKVSKTEDIGLLNGLNMFKNIAEELAKANHTIIIVHEHNEIMKIGKNAKSLIIGIFLKHIEVVDKIKTIALLRGLIYKTF
ncbi:MAG TPA: hypothetical protein ENL17_03825 [Candidatus Methanoperedenaceae archaeon]|nr:hypothetical protein [Candidatus Methanoperedenaceae archaeon]